MTPLRSLDTLLCRAVGAAAAAAMRGGASYRAVLAAGPALVSTSLAAMAATAIATPQAPLDVALALMMGALSFLIWWNAASSVFGKDSAGNARIAVLYYAGMSSLSLATRAPQRASFLAASVGLAACGHAGFAPETAWPLCAVALSAAVGEYLRCVPPPR
jgi:hypothetical protein